MSNLAAPLGPEHDIAPPAAPAQQCCIVCSTQRSGSGLLCRGLTSTGVLGAVTEYFNAANRETLTARWQCAAGLAEYVAALLPRRSAPGGTFATKLHWDQMQQLRSEALGLDACEPEFEITAKFLSDLLPAPIYVHMLRRDVNRQAISFWRALQTGAWSQPNVETPAASEEVPYSFEGIDRCRRLIENAELHWDRFFRFNSIKPIEVVYEELQARYEETVRSLLAKLIGVQANNIEIPAPQSAKMRCEHSELMLERFASDRKVRGLENPLAPDVRLERLRRAIPAPALNR